MLFLLWLTVRFLSRLLVVWDADDGTKDLEILVLRHQLRVLRRKSRRPRFTARDRVVLAAASRALPRERWASFLVTPQTLLRWHRMVIRRKRALQQDWQAADRPADRGADHADGQGEPSVGLRADLWGAAQAWHPGGRHDDQDDAATTRVGSGATTVRTELDAVLAGAGRGGRGV